MGRYLHFKPVVDRQESVYDRQRKRRSLSCHFDPLYCCRNTWGWRVKDRHTKEAIVDLRCFSLIAHRHCSRWVVGTTEHGTPVFREPVRKMPHSGHVTRDAFLSHPKACVTHPVSRNAHYIMTGTFIGAAHPNVFCVYQLILIPREF
jgi:hypothetical protein